MKTSCKHIFVLIAAFTVTVGCTLPLCENNEKICTLKILNTESCIEKCKNQDGTLCSDECMCSENSSDCIEISPKNETQACTIKICKNDLWQNDRYCEFGFDGERCNPPCITGEIRCDKYNDSDECMLRKCDGTQWNDVSVCQYGFDGERCLPPCQVGEIRCDPYDESNDCMLRKCDGTQWVDVSVCQYGFDGERCLPPCQIGEIRCDPYDESNDCMLRKCDGTQWVDVNVCQYGFDGERCLPPCQIGEIRCDPYDESNECMLRKCDGTQWNDVKVCQFGFDGETCIPPCQAGEVRCDPYDDSTQCMLKMCDGTQWSEIHICQFGFDKKVNYCVDPCNICEEHVNCPSTIYDKAHHTMYQCNQDTGWKPAVCFNDFSEINLWEVDPNVELKEFFDSDSQDEIVSNDLIYGECGECSKDESPSFCTHDNEFFYRCQNGRFVVNKAGENDCASFNDECPDDYGKISVDLTSNRYHCGECNHACGTVQHCDDGKCISNITCENHYTRVPLGSRWVQAYCIESSEDLKLIGQFHDYENAYVLVNDITIEDSWTPIEIFENGILLGNDKTIHIKKFAENTDKTGLFTQLNNVYIDNLNLTYQNDTPISTRYFGILSAKAQNVTIRNIGIKGDIHTENTIAVGGLIGLAEHGVSMTDVAMDIAIKVDNQIISNKGEYAELFNGIDTGVGGIIGVALNTDEITNISPLNENKLIFIEGTKNVGGLIGLMRHTLASSEEMTLTNKVAHTNQNLSFDISGNESIGGLIGKILTENTSMPTRIEHFIVDSVTLRVNEATEPAPVLDKENNPKAKSRYFGGILGRVEYGQKDKTARTDLVEFNNILISSIESMNPTSMESVSPSEFLGGITGYAVNTTFQNIHLNQFEAPDNALFVTLIGGIVGYAENARIIEIQIDRFVFTSVDNKAIVVGGVGGALNTVGVSNVQVGQNVSDEDFIIISCDTGGAGVAGSTAEGSSFDNIRVYGTHIVNEQMAGGMLGNGENITVTNSVIFNNLLKTTRELSLNSSTTYPVAGAVIGLQGDSRMSNVYAYSKRLEGYAGIGGLVSYVSGNSTLSNCKAFSNIYGVTGYHSGFIAYSSVNSNTLKIDNCLAESNIHTNYHAGGFISLVSKGDVTITNSASYTNMFVDNETNMKTIGGFSGSLMNNAKIYGTTTLANIITPPYLTSNKVRYSIRAATWNISVNISSSLGPNGVDIDVNNVHSMDDENKINYNYAMGYIDCPCCDDEENNCLCNSKDEVVTEVIDGLTCFKMCKDSEENTYMETDYNTICHSDETGYLSQFTSYIRDPMLRDGVATPFAPYVYINDEPEWHTAELAEYHCSCISDEDPSITEDSYTLEPIMDENCTCDPMWYELTCDVERFKTALGCEEDKCDGLIRKLKADDGKFKHRVPITPVKETNVVCDMDDYVTVDDRCYEVLKPSFCDVEH